MIKADISIGDTATRLSHTLNQHNTDETATNQQVQTFKSTLKRHLFVSQHCFYIDLAD